MNVVYEAIRQEGQLELERSTGALLWSGLAAGLSMGFSLVAEGVIATRLPDVSWRSLLSKFGYSVGFVVVILARQQLFTENTLTPMLQLFTKPNRRTLLQVARLWSTVLASNLFGAWLFAISVAHTGVFEADMREAFVEVAEAAARGGPLEHFVQGIFAGWLIALMVWMLPAAQSGRVVVIVIITYLVALSELTHVVAGAVEVFFLSAMDRASYAQAATYILPTLAGNIVGGVALTAALNHAQTLTPPRRSSG